MFVDTVILGYCHIHVLTRVLNADTLKPCALSKIYSVGLFPTWVDLISLAMVLAFCKLYTHLAALIWESFSTMERYEIYIYMCIWEATSSMKGTSNSNLECYMLVSV